MMAGNLRFKKVKIPFLKLWGLKYFKKEKLKIKTPVTIIF